MRIISNKRFHKLMGLLKIKLRERRYQQKLPYLFFDNSSDSLLIVFSAFSGDKRRYNYVKGLQELKIDKLYILDPFGYRGSYNMFENGLDYPEKVTKALIGHFLSRKKCKHIYTAGSSKGGTCAIYFGLQISTEVIFSGACQFNIGSYLHRPDHELIFRGMMGQQAGEKEERLLNRKLPFIIENNKDSKTIIHVIYSKKELTYERQIVDLLDKLRECNIPCVEKEEFFEKHDDIGSCFLDYLKKYFNLR